MGDSILKTKTVEQTLKLAEHHTAEAKKHQKLSRKHFNKFEQHAQIAFIALNRISQTTEEKHGTAVTSKED